MLLSRSHVEINVFYPMRKSGACNPISRNYCSLLQSEANRDASVALVSCADPRLNRAANGEHHFI